MHRVDLFIDPLRCLLDGYPTTLGVNNRNTMGHDLARIMDALKDELYGTATTTLGPQQQQMPSRPPRPLGDQVWALLLELGDLHGRQMLQKTPRLPPEDQ